VTAARRQRLWQLGAAGVFAAILVAVVIVISLAGSTSLQDLPVDEQAVKELFGGIPQSGLELGNQRAKTTLVEFADLQCPFCRTFTLDALPTIVDRYVRPGDLRLRFQPVTILGPQSDPAARAALAASLQNRLWEYADLFYRNQDDENSGYVTPDFLATLARATPGLDPHAALGAESAARVSRLLDESKLRFTDAGLNSTPSFLVEQRGQPPIALDVSNPGDASQFTSQLDSLTGR